LEQDAVSGSKRKPKNLSGGDSRSRPDR